MTHHFISDLHLEPSRPDVSERCISLLDSLTAPDDALYILGDLFEVWLGDDDRTEFNQRIIRALAGLAERRVKLYIMHGNRDFLLGRVFCEETSAVLLDDPSVIDCFGRRVLVMHGDSLCTRDTEYMKARSMLRGRAFQEEFLTRSLADRAAFANNARMESKAHTSTTAMEIMDVTPDEVTRAMAEAGVDLMIHGHTHRPMVHFTSGGERSLTRIVLGDWGTHGWVLTFDEAGYHLHSFPIARERRRRSGANSGSG